MVSKEDDKTRVVTAPGDDDATRVVTSPDSGPARVREAPAPAAASPAPAAVRTIKQRFVLQKVLGSGGMGAVYQAIDLRKQEANDRDPYVAIKLLNDDFRAHPDAFISLQREARKAQTLAHPNIVNVHDFDRDGDTVFMVMECLVGQPLDRLLREHADVGLPKPQALAILRDMGAALSYAHSHRIAHSDFKPGNVFVTENKAEGKSVAKVLDFGIARAVSGLGAGDEGGGEHTLFDPGSLGALTPAYASLEMLRGEAPDPRDDIYALGCVAYELFAGRHPFDKKTAQQAHAERLRPQRIRRLSRRQWRALEQALAFERAQRLPSVDLLLEAFERRRSPWLWLPVAAVLVGAVGTALYLYLHQAPVSQPDLTKLRAGVETQVKQQLAASAVDSLLKKVSYDSDWVASFNSALAAYAKLMPAHAPAVAQRRQRAGALYLAEAARRISAGQLDSAQTLLQQASHWGADIGTVQQQLQAAQQQLAEQQKAAAAARKQAAAKAAARAAAARTEAEKAAAAARAQQVLAAAEAALKSSLTCSGDMDLQAVGQRLQALQPLSAERYAAARVQTGKQLAACVAGLTHSDPAAATRLRRSALALLPGDKSLTAIKVDPCLVLSPGSGGNSSQNACSDTLAGGGRGPRLVVVPGIAGGKPYAIGKYEVSGAQFGRFCAASKACNPHSYRGSLPAHGVTPALAQKYVAWLSRQSGFHYHVPSYKQWLHAAEAGGGQPDPNRNCYLNARGLSKGGFAVPVTTGNANAWGLVNAAGNVRELTLDHGHPIAAGGGFNDPMERCIYTTRAAAGADPKETGLRVMRMLSGG